MSMQTALPVPIVADGSTIAFRMFRDLGDIPGMASANQRMRTHIGHFEPIDVDSMTNHYRHLSNCDLPRDCLVFERAGATIGYARVEWHDLEDGDRLYEHTVVVEPDAWGVGLADRSIEWSEARLRDVAAEHPTDQRAWFGGYAFGGDVEQERALLAHGYVPARWNAAMLRGTLDDLPPVPPLPAGYEIRPVPSDRLRDVGEMMTVGFREEWGQHVDQASQTEEWLGNPLFDKDLVTVAWHVNAPAAVVSSEVQAHADGRPIGYVGAVVTHPGHRRLGLARAALADNLHRLAARGLERAYLGVDADNDNRAFELYEQAGFAKVAGGTSYRKPFDGQEPGR